MGDEVLFDELKVRKDTAFLVTFGHRYQRSLSRMGSIALEEAPNVATTNPDDFGFYLVTEGTPSPRPSYRDEKVA